MSRHPKTITEPARVTSVVHETEVLVVGGGPSGLAAALAAAREGVSVGLVERYGCFGGNLTVVGVEGLAWYRHADTVEAGGLAFEFEERAKAAGAAVPESQSLSHEIDSEGFKPVADTLIEESGVHPMLHRQTVMPILDGNQIVGVVVESKAGREAILSQIVIDATGDADIAHRAGAPTIKTPSADMLSASVMFHLSGVNKAKFLAATRADPQTYKDWSSGDWEIETDGKEDDMYSPFLKRPFEEAIKAGVIPPDIDTIAGTWGAIHDSGELTYLNLVHLDGVDGTDPDSLTRGEIEGRKRAMLALAALKSFMPGCNMARLRNFGMSIGIRDTRKIDAVYNLSTDDVRNQGRFEDSIGIYPEFIDGYGLLVLPTTGRYMQIPYRAILPQGIQQLLVVGRAIGGDRTAHAATRNMACCIVTGQGAGIAAAQAVKSRKMVHEVDIAEVQAHLKMQSVRIS